MNRTKQKLYGTVLAVVVCGLAVDLFIVGDPRSARATPPAVELIGAAAVDQEASAHQYDMPRQFPENLPSVDGSRHVRNPFIPPEVIRRRRSRRAGTVSPDGAGSQVGRRRPGEPLSVAEFIATHRLTGVYVGQSAIVDGRIVQIGQKFDSSVLVKISGNRVHFQCKDGQAVLTLDNPP